MDPELASRYDLELRRRLPPPPGRERVEAGDGRLVRIVGPTSHPLDNMVCSSTLADDDADETIRALVEDARRERRGVQWNVYAHDEPSDLVERLARAGFVAQEREQVMLLASDAPSLARGLADGVAMRRVTDERGLADVVAVQEAVWGTGHTEWLLAWWRPALRGEGVPVGLFVAEVGGRPAGTAWVTLPPRGTFAGLFGGTVLAEHRRRGVHRSLVVARAALAREAGIPWVVADANARSAPPLARLGFRAMAVRTEMVLAAPASPSR